MATIGQRLTAPEPGWKRYALLKSINSWDGTILVQGKWNIRSQAGTYFGYDANTQTGKITFEFVGTKLRLITTQQWRGGVGKITIDGVSGVFNCYADPAKFQVLVYEIQGLENTRHTVTIESNSGITFVDAIDIDDTGRLLHPDEVTDIKDLDIGKRIRCHYQASSGQVGVFSGLGEETSDFIPPTSSANPNGDFYWICVNRDHLGRWKLIADRNIQHSISWDKINEQGMTNTGREITF